MTFSVFLDSLCPVNAPGFGNRCLNALAWFGSRSFDLLVVHVPVMLVSARFVTRNSGMDFYEARELFRYTLPGFAIMLVICILLLFLLDGIRKLTRRKKPNPSELAVQ